MTLYDSRNGHGRTLCTLPLSNTQRLDKSAFTGAGCENDEAMSAEICYAKNRTNIRFYDDPGFEDDDDWYSIDVEKDLSKCVKVWSFNEGYKGEIQKNNKFLPNGVKGGFHGPRYASGSLPFMPFWRCLIQEKVGDWCTNGVAGYVSSIEIAVPLGKVICDYL